MQNQEKSLALLKRIGGGNRTKSCYFTCFGRDWGVLVKEQEIEIYNLTISPFDKSLLPFQVIFVKSSNDVHEAFSVCCNCPPLDAWSFLPYRPLHELRTSKESNGMFAVASSTKIVMYSPSNTETGPGLWSQAGEIQLLSTLVEKTTSICFSPGGDFVLVGTTLGLALYAGNNNNNACFFQLAWVNLDDFPCKSVTLSAFSSDGRLFATCTESSNMVRIWWRDEGSTKVFKFRILSHPSEVVSTLSWRPRFGASQTLLTSTANGTIRLWQESDVYEEFQFDLAAVLNSNINSENCLVEWIKYAQDYQGFLWPPNAPKGFNNNSASPVKKPSNPGNTALGSRFRFGAMEKGHGHTHHGDAIFDFAESRIGSTLSTAKTLARDWVLLYCPSKGVVKIWSIEALGEHVRRGLRSELFFETAKLNLPWQEKVIGVSSDLPLVVCRVSTPPSVDLGLQSLPHKPNALESYFPPETVVLAFRNSHSGSIHSTVLSVKTKTSYSSSTLDIKPALKLCGNKKSFACLNANEISAFSWTGSSAIVDHTFTLPLDTSAVVDFTLSDEGAVFFALADGSVHQCDVVLKPSTSQAVVSKAALDEFLAKNDTGATGRVVKLLTISPGGVVCLVFEYLLLVFAKGAIRVARKSKLRVTTACAASLLSCVLYATENGSVHSLNLGGGEEATPQTETAFSPHLKIQSAYAPLCCVHFSSMSGRIGVLTAQGQLFVAEDFYDARVCEVALSREDRLVDFCWCEFGCGVEALCVLTQGARVCMIARAKRGQWYVLTSNRLSPGPQSTQLSAGGEAGYLMTWLAKGRLMVLEPHSGVLNVFSGDLSASRGADVLSLLAGAQVTLPDFHPRYLLEIIRAGGNIELLAQSLKHLRRELQEGRTDPVVVRALRPSQWRLAKQHVLFRRLSSLSVLSDSFGSFSSHALDPPSDEEDGDGGPRRAAANSLLEEPALRELEEAIQARRIASFTPRDHLLLLSVIDAYRRYGDFTQGKLATKLGLDAFAARFVLIAQTLKKQEQLMDNQREAVALHTSDVIWAVYSRSSDAALLQTLVPLDAVWAECRLFGVGLWLHTPDAVLALVERLAKTSFVKGNKDPFKCLLYYVLLNKTNVVAALFKGAKNDKVATMLSRDFRVEANREIAAKNAFALLSKHRFEEAVSFFILAGKPDEAVRVCVRYLEDYQLAILLVRCLHRDAPAPKLKELLHAVVLPFATACHDVFLASICHKLLGDELRAAECFVDQMEHASLAPGDKDWFLRVAVNEKPVVVSGFDPSETLFLKELFGDAGTDLRIKQLLEAYIVKSELRSARFYVNEGLAHLALHVLLSSTSASSNVAFRALLLDAAARVGVSCCVAADNSRALEEDVRALSEYTNRGVEYDALLQELERACMNLHFARAEVLCATIRGRADRVLGGVVARVAHTLFTLGVGSTREEVDCARRLAGLSLLLSESLAEISADTVSSSLSPKSGSSSNVLLAAPASSGVEALVKSVAAGAVISLIVAALLTCRYSTLVTVFELAPSLLAGPFPPALAGLARDICVATSSNGRRGEEPGSTNASTLIEAMLRFLVVKKALQSTQGCLGNHLDHSARVLLDKFLHDVHFCSRPAHDSNVSEIMAGLRKFISASSNKDAFDFSGQHALWTLCDGADALQGFTSELALTGRHRAMYDVTMEHHLLTTTTTTSKTPVPLGKGLFLSRAASQGKGGNNAAATHASLMSVVLYQKSGQTIHDVVVSKCLPNYMILATDSGTRDVNIPSSLQFRERSADGRSLLDQDGDTWAQVFGRFRASEVDSAQDATWELLMTNNSLDTFLKRKQKSSGSLLPPATTAAGQSAANRRHISISIPSKNKQLFFSWQHALHSKVVLSGRFLAERVTHDIVPTSSVACHPFLPHYVSGGADATVLLWNIGEPRAHARFACPSNQPIARVRVSKCGTKIAALDAGGRLFSWNLDVDPSSIAPLSSLQAHEKSGSDCVFLNLSTIYCTSSVTQSEIAIFDELLPSRSKRVLSRGFPECNGVYCLGYSAGNPNRVIAGGGNSTGGVIGYYDLRMNKFEKVVKNAHSKAVTSLDFEPLKGTVIASGSADGSIKLWSNQEVFSSMNAIHGALNNTSIATQGVTSITFAENCTLLSCGGDGMVKALHVGGIVV